MAQSYNPLTAHNFPQQADSRELKLNQYYLIISASGDVLKTKFKPEFIEVCKWENIIYFGIVSNTKTLFYKIGEKEYSEKIKSLKTSDPFSKDGCFHFTDLEHNGHTIKSAWIEATIPKRLRL